MEEFKKYLFENRDQLDKEAAPSHRVWEQVRKQTGVVKTPGSISFMKWVAAAGIVALATAGVFWWTLTKPTHKELAVTDTTTTNTGTRESVVPEPGNAKAIIDTALIGPEPVIASRKKTIARKRIPASKKIISPIRDLETNYATIINYQLKKLERTPIYAESPGYFHVFKKQWLDLSRDEKKIRHDMNAYGLDDQVVGQLIRLYQQKLQLLQQLQTEINTMNNRTKGYPALRKNPPAYFKM